MIARLLVTGALLALLVLWDRSLAREASDERRDRADEIGRILPQSEFEALEVAAIRLEWGDGQRALYGPDSNRVWRVAGINVPVDVQALESLLGAVTSAEGRVQSEDGDQAATYGIGTGDSVRFSICNAQVLRDPQGSVEWSCDLGRALPDGEGSFLRPAGSSAIWAVDKNPRAILERGRIEGLPPMVDPTLATLHWLQRARGYNHLFVDRADGSSVELKARPREVTEEEMRQGVPNHEWVLDPEGEALVAPLRRSMAFAFFLQRAGYTSVLDPSRAQEYGLGGPHHKVTLFPATPGVEALELRVFPEIGGLGVPVVNSVVGVIYAVDPEVAALLVPDRDTLMDAAAANPWDEFLEDQH